MSPSISTLATPQQRLAQDRQNIRDRFLLVDGHALIYRAYHAFPELTTDEGLLVNAVYGFARILLTAFRDFRPEYVAVCFDSKEKTKRAEQYAQYKAHRPEMPADLVPQIELVKELVEALSVPAFAKSGLEADDLLGAISRLLSELKREQATPLTVILTGDKDLLQLVDEDVRVLIPGRGQRQGDLEYDPETVERVLGLRPDQIVDWKALMGDPSDNIPGVRGVGKKTAQRLLERYQTLDNLYQAVEEAGRADPLLTKSLLAKLEQGRADAYLSQGLARIDRSEPLAFELEACRVRRYDKERARQLLSKLGFRSLIHLLPQDEFELSVQEALF